MTKKEKNKNKKAQMKIQETAFVLLAIVLLFSLVFMFYLRLHSSKLAKEAAELQQKQAISLLNKVAAMPELRCSESLSSDFATEVLCIDEDKLESMTESFTEDYKNMWKGLREAKIVEIYPASEIKKEFVLYKGSGKEKEYRTYSTFVPLCKMEHNGVGWYRCNVGMISITIGG